MPGLDEFREPRWRRRARCWGATGLLVGLLIPFVGEGSTGSLVVEPGGERLPGYCSLFSDDIVVRGVIEAADTTEVPSGSWMPKVPEALRTREPIIEITRVTMAIDEVMKGKTAGRSFEFSLPSGDYNLGHNYAIGDTMIVSCRYWEHRLGGSYSVRSDCGRFIRRGGAWVNQKGYGNFSLDEIREMLRKETDVRYFVKEADVIAEVRSAGSVEQQPALERSQQTEQIWLVPARIIRVLRGDGAGESLSFLVGGPRNTAPWWNAREFPAPLATVEGRWREGRWLVFLKRGPVGLYPMGGGNGMLKIEGEKLLYDNRVEYPYRLSEIEALVGKEVQR